MKAIEYVVYRRGSNAANQPMTPVMPIGIYTGVGPTALARRIDACEQAAREHTIYANQFLTALPLARATVEDREAAFENQLLAANA